MDLGHSVFVLDFGNGGADMNDNSEIHESAILKINELTPDQILLIGMSMGGVISRHALVNMETNSIQHNVSHFVSLDSPQQGAVMDEEFLDHIYDEEPNNDALGSMAAMQLLKYNPYRSQNYHQSFYSELQNMDNYGYPTGSKNIGVSLANPSEYREVGKWLEINGKFTSPFLFNIPWFSIPTEEFFIDTSHETYKPGSLLPFRSTSQSGSGAMWEHKVFYVIYHYSLVRHSDATFIQYDSALDINNGISRFDVTIHPTQTYYHDILPL